jgi:hypothetical protein
MASKKFFSKFSKYMLIALAVAGVAALITTGVGAVLGGFGLLGLEATSALGGMAFMWQTVGAAMAAIGSSVAGFIGIGAATAATTAAGTVSIPAAIAGASAIVSGVSALAAGAAAVSSHRETQHDPISRISKKSHELRKLAAIEEQNLVQKAKDLEEGREKLGHIKSEVQTTENLFKEVSKTHGKLSEEEKQIKVEAHKIENTLNKLSPKQTSYAADIGEKRQNSHAAQIEAKRTAAPDTTTQRG